MDRCAVRARVVEALADVEGLSAQEVEAAIMAVGGDSALELDSKQAECVIAGLEVVFGCQLPAPADLDRTQFATLEALVDLVATAMSTG